MPRRRSGLDLIIYCIAGRFANRPCGLPFTIHISPDDSWIAPTVPSVMLYVNPYLQPAPPVPPWYPKTCIPFSHFRASSSEANVFSTRQSTGFPCSSFLFTGSSVKPAYFMLYPFPFWF